MKNEYAIYNHAHYSIEYGKPVKKVEKIKVRVMSSAEGYAMVRRRGCIPFVVSEKDLDKS